MLKSWSMPWCLGSFPECKAPDGHECLMSVSFPTAPMVGFSWRAATAVCQPLRMPSARQMQHQVTGSDRKPAQELEESSRAMGYAAVKYADLKNARLTNYKFSFDDMLALKGNTAVYLLYAHARLAGIVRNAGVDVDGAPHPSSPRMPW